MQVFAKFELFNTQRLINVDMAIPPKIVHAMTCLDNTKWWGFPKSVQAALTVVIPESPEAEA